MAARGDAAGLLARPNRLTVRMRLTLTYAALFSVAGAVMIALIYVFMRYVPTYAITSVRATQSGMAPATQQSGYPASLDGSASFQMTEGLTSASGTAALVVSDESDILNTLLIWSLIVLVVLVGLSAWVGWILSGRLLRPLHEINLAAQRAATGAFDHRVALSGPRDEITELSDTFDHMLERLGRSFRAHQRFAANASHELRTPLATTQAMLDVAAHTDHLDDAATELLISRLRETNTRSILTVEAMLDLADADRLDIVGVPVDLALIVEEAIDQLEPERRSRSIQLTSELRSTLVAGDAALLSQVVVNLLGNAIRHNHEDGTIAVHLRQAGGPSGGGAVLVVENSGPVIAREVVPRLTEPFYRDRGRVSTGADGSRGLGLAIVDGIVAAHAAELELRPRAGGGLRATVSFARVERR